MRTTSAARKSLTLVALLVCAAAAGCSSEDIIEQFIPLANVGGTWNYQIDNAAEAIFTTCTGDATVLEGSTWNEGLLLAPICHLDASFIVTQTLAVVVVVPHNVTCSDNSSALVTGGGLVTETTVQGQYSASNQNVNFAGTVSGSTITLTEDMRDFSGSFQGSCAISPPLSATVTIQ